MKAVLFIFLFVSITGFSAHAETVATSDIQSPNKSIKFDKVESTSVNPLKESRVVIGDLDNAIQPLKGRPRSTLRASLGSASGVKAVGPTGQFELAYRIGETLPLQLAIGTGYLMQTKQNAAGASRNYHEVPVTLTAQYIPRLVGQLRLNVGVGPTVRTVFERGNLREHNSTYSYGDLYAAAGLDYEWMNRWTQASKSVGVRFSRVFGVPSRIEAPAVDSVLASFTFDL